MKIKYNRFALLPHTCSKCEKAFWFEPYKHCKIESFGVMGCVEYITNICKECAEVLEHEREVEDECKAESKKAKKGTCRSKGR